MRLKYLFILALGVVALSGCAAKVEEIVAFKEGDPAPKLDVDVLQGALAAPGEGVQIIEFWATWCAPCKDSAPFLSSLQERYGYLDVSVLGISDEDETVVKPYLAEFGQDMAYTVALDPEGVTQKKYLEGYGVEGIPWAFLIDRYGSLAWVGHPMSDELEENLLELLDIPKE